MALTQISTAGVKDDAVTSGKIPANAVGTSEIANDAVTAAKLADDIAINTTGSITSGGVLKTTGNVLTVEGATPRLNLIDTNNNSDFEIGNTNGTLNIADSTNGANRLRVLSNGTTIVTGNLDAESGLDVTGNITCTGTIPAAQLTGTLPAIDGSNLTGITQTTINNNADNRVITGSGTANTLNSESAFTFDGSIMHINTSNNILAKFESTDADALIEFKDNSTSDSILVGCVTGNDLLFRTDAGKMVFSLANNNEKMRLDSSGNLGLGITNTTEDTTGDSGPKFITAGDIQIDGDQKALVFRSTSSAAQLQSGIQWWNENGAGVQAKIHCDRTDIIGADSDLVFYTTQNVDTSANNSEGNITEQMRISSAGYVTKPNQPAFRAARQSTDLDVGQGSPIIFNQASGSYKHFNTGGHYNTSNGRFTAPVAGVYHFHALIIWENVSNNTNMTDSFDFYINNSQAAYSSRRAYYNNGTTGQGGYFTDHATMTIKLSANDYVWCRNKHSNKRIHNNDTYTVFHGHLVG